MSILLGSRLFLLAGLLLPIFSAHANLNRGDSPLREIPFGKLADVRTTAPPVSRLSAAHLPPTGYFESDTVEAGESDTEAKSPDDERYFGSATWSEVSKPRMVDFSFGQPCGPFLWWESSDAEPLTIVPESEVVALPKATSGWENSRPSANPSREPSTNAGMALFPLSLLGVLGLVLRRG